MFAQRVYSRRAVASRFDTYDISLFTHSIPLVYLFFFFSITRRYSTSGIVFA